MPSISFELGGLPVIITARSSHLIEIFADYFRYYQPQLTETAPASSSSAGPLTFTARPLVIKLKTKRDLPPLERLIPRTAELLVHAGSVQMWREAANLASRERFYFHTGAAAFRVEPERGSLEGLITPSALKLPHLLANTYTLLPLLLLLRARGLYHLHAAAVLSPRGELYLLCGAQRSGKTTLATALGLAGWQPVSDDSLLLQASSSTAQLFALKKTFHLSNQVLARWSALEGIARHHHYLERTCVAALEFFGTTQLAESRFEKVAYLVLPQITGGGSTKLQSISAGEAILKLAEQSIFFQLWREHTEQQLSLLTHLAGAASCYRFLAGEDLLAFPQRAAEILEQAGERRWLAAKS